MEERTAEEIDAAAFEEAFAEAMAKVEDVLSILDTIEKYVSIEFDRTGKGPVMWVRSKTLGQAWLIHITEEEYENSVRIQKIVEETQAKKENA